MLELLTNILMQTFSAIMHIQYPSITFAREYLEKDIVDLYLNYSFLFSTNRCGFSGFLCKHFFMKKA